MTLTAAEELATKLSPMIFKWQYIDCIDCGAEVLEFTKGSERVLEIMVNTLHSWLKDDVPFRGGWILA